MTDKELIKQEIKRRLNLYESQFTGYESGRKDEAKSILDFIDSLQNEDSSDECPCCGWALDSDGCCSSCGYGRK